MRNSTYDTWYSMVRRCTNSEDKSFNDYGGRGIDVAPEWLAYSGFVADMGERPSGLQLDRIDNDLGYCKSNCRWATALQNGNNKRNNVCITARGETRSLSEWSRVLGKPFSTLFSRHYRGWPAERVIS
jgi:hypothetical protein